MTGAAAVPARSPVGVAGPIVNTHVHVPPNFSAFTTVEEVVAAAAREGLAVLGTSNFHDLRVYGRVAAAAEAHGILALHGIEIISTDEELRRDGILVNDPANPGRIYVCGKGLDPFAEPGPEARALRETARTADEGRARAMAGRLAAVFAEAGLDTGLTDEVVAEEVAARAGVQRGWVVLQERHLALAFQEALFRLADPQRRRAVLARAFGADPAVDPADAVALQGEIRARLMKAGRPAFVEETPVSFADARRIILGLGGIPCYPTLADGADPVCAWETPPPALADRVLARGTYVAELIPIRNQPGAVDAHVAAFRDAGILVMAGTEHNTPARIPLRPRCVDGSLPSPAARAAFLEATRVVAAHQHLRASGRPGYVDGEGRLAAGFPDAASRIRWFSELGADLISDRTKELAR